MTKKKTVEDVKKAQEVVSLVGKVIPSEISQEDYLSLIKIYYTHIGGVPLEDIPHRQKRMIATKLYLKALLVTGGFEEQQKEGLAQIIKLCGVKKIEKIETIGERICKSLESYPLEGLLSRIYKDVKINFN